MTDKPTPAVLMVCLGNICRSPSAEAVLRARAVEAGISISVASAGTGNWHVGQPPDERAIKAAAKRDIDMRDLRAQQVCADDFARFTHIFAMDQSNLADLKAMRPKSGTMPMLFMDMAANPDIREIPDPYYGGVEGFSSMLDLIEDAAQGFIKTIVQDMGGRS